jgi:hypothetical protein
MERGREKRKVLVLRRKEEWNEKRLRKGIKLRLLKE